MRKITFWNEKLIEFFFFYFSLFLCSHYRKARRKEKDGDQNSNDTKLYLEESVLERKLTDANLNTIVELPAGLDYNEWLASHSKYIKKINFYYRNKIARSIQHFSVSITKLSCTKHCAETDFSIEWCTESRDEIFSLSSHCPENEHFYAVGYASICIHREVSMMLLCECYINI